MPRAVTAPAVHDSLAWGPLADALAAAFAAGADVPQRHVHALAADDALLLMPAWNAASIGTKVVTVIPGATAHGAPTVNATYLLLDRPTGIPRAVIDGDALTVRRTAAVSALAARYAMRADARTLLVIGTGHLAPWMARAHVALHPAFTRVLCWGRDATRTAAMVRALREEQLPAEPVTVLADAVAAADCITCATTSHEPIILGAWLRPGTHVDCVGGFTRIMREVDDTAVARSRVVVDTWGALAEAGDLLVPIEQGVIDRTHIVADLAAVVRGEAQARTHDAQITLFKSVGTALADLAAATLVASVLGEA